MPLIVFDCKGIPATRRERIETAVETGGRHVKEQYEGWIAADPFRGGVRVVISRPQGSSGRCGSLWTKIRRSAPSESGRRSTSESIIGSLGDSRSDKTHPRLRLPLSQGLPRTSATTSPHTKQKALLCNSESARKLVRRQFLRGSGFSS